MKFKKFYKNINLTLWILLLFELGNVVFIFIFFKKNGYLPAPFFYQKNDTFMDFYNPLMAVINNTFYFEYKSIYPPINFFILKFFSLFSEGGYSGASALREHEGLVLWVYLFMVALAIFLTIINDQYKIFSKKNRIILVLLSLLSIPVLYGIERGNLIFFSLPFIGLYCSEGSYIKRAIIYGMLVNLKPYFALLIISSLASKRRYFEAFFSILFSILLFLGFSSFVDLNYWSFLTSYFGFGKNVLSHEGVIGLGNSITSFASAGRLISVFAHMNFWFSLIKAINYLTIIYFICILFFNINRLSRSDIIIAVVVIITNISTLFGGYIFIIYIPVLPIIFLLESRKTILIILAIIFCMPLDFFNLYLINTSDQYSFLFGQFVTKIEFYFTLGSLLRPIANYSILLILIFTLKHKISNFDHSVKMLDYRKLV